MDKEGNIHESATINVIEASTVPESPVGLVEIMVDNSRLHPCSEQSGVMVHDLNCPLNHELYFQDDYISIEQCPNWYGKTVPAGRAGIVKMSFKIGHNYSVDSDGRSSQLRFLHCCRKNGSRFIQPPNNLVHTIVKM